MQYSRRISLSLTAAFLLIVFGMPLSQAALELARGDRPHALELLLHVPTKANLRQFERELDNAAWAIRRSLPGCSCCSSRFFTMRGGTRCPGETAGSFSGPASVIWSNPCPSRPGIPPPGGHPYVQGETDARGIALVVMPAPERPASIPNYSRAVPSATWPMNRHTLDLLARLRDAGVTWWICRRCFAGVNVRTVPRAGLALVARGDGTRQGGRPPPVRPRPGETGRHKYAERPAPVERLGDLILMMQSPPVERLLRPNAWIKGRWCRRIPGPCMKTIRHRKCLCWATAFCAFISWTGRARRGLRRIWHGTWEAGRVGHQRRRGFDACTAGTGAHPGTARQQTGGRVGICRARHRFGTEGWQIVPLPPPS